MSKHTPGPWKIVREGSSEPSPAIILAKYLRVIVDHGEDFGDPSHDARLIAAAPDLLALAVSVAEHFTDTDAPLGIQARTAIARAEGKAAT